MRRQLAKVNKIGTMLYFCLDFVNHFVYGLFAFQMKGSHFIISLV